MSTIPRILKNLGAILTGRLLSILEQVVLPPIFIYRYGLSGFGEWIVLSGAISALGLLNFGVQTYMNQDLAIRSQRGETEGYRVRQSTALRLLLGIVLVAALLCLSFFAIPFDTLLRLDLTRTVVQTTLYLLALELLLTILFGYLGGIFMGIAQAHRGANWNNAQALLSTVGVLIGVVLHLSFPVLAAIQLVCLLVCLAGVLVDLRRTAPQLFPTLRYWEGAAVPGILYGSAYFGMIMMSTFLAYEAPLLILQRVVGSVAVTGFTLMRTIFSMARQLLSMVTQSMGAEITHLFGRKDWPLLVWLYDSSERLVLFLIATVNLGVLMLSPVLITLWVARHQARSAGHTGASSLFIVTPYVLSSALSMVISLKEHKFQFQFSTNTHTELARTMFFSYVAMVLLSVVTIHYWGVNGFLWTWLAAETLQLLRLIGMNRRLFAHVQAIDTGYLLRLALLCGVGLAGAVLLLPRSSALPLFTQTGIALVAAAVAGALAWKVFRVREVYSGIVEQLSKRFA
jgi:O-antigen/teichoic acid export membrane protein